MQGRHQFLAGFLLALVLGFMTPIASIGYKYIVEDQIVTKHWELALFAGFFGLLILLVAYSIFKAKDLKT